MSKSWSLAPWDNCRGLQKCWGQVGIFLCLFELCFAYISTSDYECFYRWLRSPCVMLKECIDQRPKNGTDHFSKSFEDFAMNLVINDPSEEAKCMQVREELGFDSNHPDDAEVCRKFESHMCAGFFTEVDELVKDLSNVPDFQAVKYEKVM